MGYRMYVSMNIAIIGCGEVADGYAAGFALAGHNVFLAWKNGVKRWVNPGLTSLDNVYLTSIEEAAGIADLIIIATMPKEVREVSYWLGDVRHKTIIDATCNI